MARSRTARLALLIYFAFSIDDIRRQVSICRASMSASVSRDSRARRTGSTGAAIRVDGSRDGVGRSAGAERPSGYYIVM